MANEIQLDIVTRLTAGTCGARIAVCAEAATEILRLREALRLAMHPDVVSMPATEELREYIPPAPLIGGELDTSC